MNDHDKDTSKPLPFSRTKLNSDTGASSSCSSVVVPTPPSVTSESSEQQQKTADDKKSDNMEESHKEAKESDEKSGPDKPNQEKQEDSTAVKDGKTKDGEIMQASTKTRGSSKTKGGKSKKENKEAKGSTQSEDSDASAESDSESSSTSEDEKSRAKRKKKASSKKSAAKKKRTLNEKRRSKKRGKKHESVEDSSSDSPSDTESESEDDDKKSKKKKKAKTKSKEKKKSTKSKKSKKHVCSEEEDSSSSSSSSTSSGESSDDERSARKRKAKRKSKKSRKADSDSSSLSSSESSSEEEATSKTKAAAAATAVGITDDMDLQTRFNKLAEQILAAKDQMKLQQATNTTSGNTATTDASTSANTASTVAPKSKTGSLEYKRVDQVWDSKARDYKITESIGQQKDEFDCVFTVRRRFNWENKHAYTVVDIKSKVLRSSLQAIFKDCREMSLVEEVPAIDPNMLFLYFSELKTYYKRTLRTELKRAKKSKDKKQVKQKIAQCKLLTSYVDEDFESTRKALKPMVKAGTITYSLLWALFKPNTIAFTYTYGNKDDPRAFKIDGAWHHEDWLGNKKWIVCGRYLDYNGKKFGLAEFEVDIPSFKGHKKIASLPVYPIKYHKDPEGMEEQLIERGKKFITLQGQNYRMSKGLAYMKVRRTVQRFQTTGRVMVDPAIFRRINPNYPVSQIKQDEFDQEGDSESECDCSDGFESEKEEMRQVVWKDRKGKKHLITVPASTLPSNDGSNGQKLENRGSEQSEQNHTFTEEELLIASPVVLGFAFSHKYWLELSLSGIEEIQWNSDAFDTLVLPTNIKMNLKGLVSNHRFNAAKTIDDVIKGKGKGLNVVLHGPPGVGKTLTGESIAEYLRCPLYSVSAGELGTNSRQLETDLNRIMDVTHSWGAILLLDEADVFLEARQTHDIHRNALVSVFLRLTEYYQGILFLTTNRVETFDEAFQSRIHMGIKYENLKPQARKKIWEHHIGKVVEMAGAPDSELKVGKFENADFAELSKRNMNGRQIKNTVKISQSVALSEKEVFSMDHVRRVLDQHQAFEDDMRGGRGYREAMRQYT